MKTITVWFEGMAYNNKNFNVENFYPYKLLKQHYNVIITDKNPQYIFCSYWNEFSYCRFNGIRIYYSEECFFPNLNIVDYMWTTCMDIHQRDRICCCSPNFTSPWMKELLDNRNYTLEDIKRKKQFCNYIYSHDKFNIRTEIFNKLSEYKRVDSAGKYLNNMDGWHPGTREDANPGVNSSSKFDFQKNFKFTIAFENFSYPEYNTEKIIDAFIAGTIPIYWGDPEITKIYNPKAFINVMDYNSIDEVIERVKEIDNDDDLFLQMINEPVFNGEKNCSNRLHDLDNFILHIFEQEYNSAFRRSLFGGSFKKENNSLLLVTPKLIRYYKGSLLKRIVRILFSPKRLLNTIKQTINSKKK